MVQTTSRRIGLSLLTAALAFGAAVMPAHAQSAYPVSSRGELTVQNNRTVPVTVYLEASPFERELGKVEAMRTATFSLPKHMMREGETVELLVQPRGQLPLKAMGVVSESSHLGFVLPATPHQLKHADHEMVAWEMRGEPVVTQSVVTEEEEIQD